MNFEIYHPLHKYSVYSHSKWQCHITNETYVCSSRYCQYKAIKPLFASKDTLTSYTPNNPTDCCPHCDSPLHINVRLKFDEDTAMTDQLDYPQPHRSRHKKYLWLTKELSKHKVCYPSESRFGGLVQYHEFN